MDINFDAFDKVDVNSGVCAATIYSNDGRIFQKVALKPNTNYTLSCYLKIKSTKPQFISGYSLLGAFTTDKEDIISGVYPTNRINVDSTLLIQLSDVEDFYQKYSFTFNSEEFTEALIGIFHCSRAVKNMLFVDDFSLVEEGKNDNLVSNSSFEDDSAWTYINSSKKEYKEV